MQILETKFEDRIQLDIEGRVDVTSAPVLQNDILKAFQKTNILVINLEKTQFVSSAGIRSFLIGQKTASSKGGSMRLINVPDSVKDVFDLTGFSKIFNIE